MMRVMTRRSAASARTHRKTPTLQHPGDNLSVVSDELAQEWSQTGVVPLKLREFVLMRHLCRELQAHDITTVQLNYDGSGDDGQIDGMTLYNKEGFRVDADDLAGVVTGAAGERYSVGDAIEQVAMDQIPDGFEEGNGSFGSVTITVKNGTLAVAHSARTIEEDETRSQALSADKIQSHKKILQTLQRHATANQPVIIDYDVYEPGDNPEWSINESGKSFEGRSLNLNALLNDLVDTMGGAGENGGNGRLTIEHDGQAVAQWAQRVESCDSCSWEAR